MFSTHSNRRSSRRSVLYSAVQNSITGVWTTGTPSVADYDANFDKTQLLLTGDGSNNQTNAVFLDSSGLSQTVTRNGDTTQGSFNPYISVGTQYDPNLHGGSAYFDGTGDYLTLGASSDFTLGSRYTIELWFYTTTVAAGNAGIVNISTAASGNSGINIYRSTAEILCNNGVTGGTGPSSGASTVTANTWTHLAVVCDGTNTKSYLNGVLKDTYVGVTGSGYSPTYITIGAFGDKTAAFSGYISNLHIIKGWAKYTGAFTPPSAPVQPVSNLSGDEYYSTLTALLHFDGSNGSTTFTDVTGKTWTGAGGISINNAQSKFGGTSLASGSGKYLSYPSGTAVTNLANTTTCTIEAWVYRNSSSSSGELIARSDGSLSNWWVIITSGGYLRIGCWNGSAVVEATGTTQSVPSQTWTHVAFVATSGVMKFFVNGVQDATSPTITTPGGSWANQTRLAANFDGYIDDFRVHDGTALYSANFTPPTAPFPDLPWYRTSLLLKFINGGIIDSAAKYDVLTYGSAKVSSSQSKFGGTSMYFDGTSNCYLRCSTPAETGYGSGDFTMEFWVYLVSQTSQSRPLGNWGDGAYGANCWSFHTNSGAGTNFAFYSNNANASAAILVSTTTPSLSTWYHVAVSRIGSTFRLFVNGVQEASATYAGSIDASGNNLLFVGGSPVANSPMNAYLDDVRITKGLGRYAANFTPPSLPLPTTYRYYPADFYNNYWNETKLLLQGDFVNSNTSIIRDNSKNRYSPVNVNMVVSNAQQKFGTHSLYNGGSGYLSYSASADFTLGTGDFTIEAWVYPTSISTNNDAMICGNWNGVTWAANCYSFHVDHSSVGNTDKNSFWVYNYSSSAPLLLSTSSITTNVWRHVAVSRVGSTFRLFVNGVLEATATYAGSVDTGSTNVLFVAGATGGTQPQTGYMDDFRFTKGVGRYTQQFIPPTSAFLANNIADADPFWTSTTLLLHADGANNQNNAVILDSSGLNHTVTRAGDVAQGSFTPYAPAALVPYNPSSHCGSAYFDGSGDYLTLDGSSDFAFGTGDFTIEMWIYRTASPGVSQNLYDSRPASTNGWYPVMYISGAYHLFFHTNSVDRIDSGAGNLIAINTWYHVALCRASGTTRLFMNGAVVGTPWADTSTYICGASRPAIGIGGTDTTSFPLNGYISNLNVVKGTAKYTGAFTPPPSPVTPHANTKLLLNFTNAAIYDSKAKKNIAVAGDTKTMVAVSKFGGSSMYFDGVGDQLSGNIAAIGTQDYTVEAWVYPSNVSGLKTIWNATNSSMFINETGLWIFCGTSNVNAYTSTLTANAWHHIAVCRVSGVVRGFINGVEILNFSSTADLTPTTYTIGGRSADYFVGYIDDFRVTTGVGRYASNFEPPTRALPDY